MARPRPDRVTPVVVEVVVPWRRDRVLRRLTNEIHRINRDTGRTVVMACVEQGKRLIEARERLPHGSWERWIENALPFSKRSAQRYVRLARWARTNRAELRRLSHLGLAKLMRIIALDEQTRDHIPLRTPIAVPGLEQPKTVSDMSIEDLEAVIGDLTDVTTDTGNGDPPIANIIQGLRHRIASTRAWATTIIERADEVDRQTATALRKELRAILKDLDTAFA